MTDYIDYTAGFRYLDNLRESGVTNMFGARPYVEQALGLTKQEASLVLSKWMATFDGESSVDERVAKAEEQA